MSKLVGYDNAQKPPIPGFSIFIKNEEDEEDEEDEDEMKIEVKSITDKKENALIRLSTIQGWKDLPKLLVIFDSENIRSPPIKRPNRPSTKSRDLEVKILDYSLHYFTEESGKDFVEMTSNLDFKKITSIKHGENPDEYDKIKAHVERINENSKGNIKLKVEKNGQNTRVHYQCKRDLLPICPADLSKEIEPKVDKLIGCQLKLWKSLSKVGYKDGYLDEAMVRWEEDNKKSTGILHALLPGGVELKFPDFKHGRQDYWGGFALELVLEDLNNAMSLTPGGTMGQDIKLKTLDNWRFFQKEDEIKYAAKKFGKHKILREIQSLLGVSHEDSDISKGSTVTLSGLARVAKSLNEKLGGDIGSLKTKAKCISSMLELVGGKSDQKDVSKGGTITAYALYKIYRGFINTNPEQVQ
jgi:hypothetical protein